MGDYRITNNDPNYERTKGQRNARSIGFVAKILGWLGVAIFAVGILSGNGDTIAAGIGWLFIWGLLKLVSQFLHNRFET